MELQKLKAQLEPLIVRKQEVDKDAHRWGCSCGIMLPSAQLLQGKQSAIFILSACAIRTVTPCRGRVMRPRQQESQNTNGWET